MPCPGCQCLFPNLDLKQVNLHKIVIIQSNRRQRDERDRDSFCFFFFFLFWWFPVIITNDNIIMWCLFCDISHISLPLCVSDDLTSKINCRLHFYPEIKVNQINPKTHWYKNETKHCVCVCARESAFWNQNVVVLNVSINHSDCRIGMSDEHSILLCDVSWCRRTTYEKIIMRSQS